MARLAKLHRGYERVGTWGNRTTRSGRPILSPSCGIYGRADVLTNAEFQWLPRERQCEICLSNFFPVAVDRHVNGGLRADVQMPGVKSMTDEMRIALDHFFLSFARFCLDLVELKATGWRHRCHYRCWQSGPTSLIEACGGCGGISWLDVVSWSVAIARWHPLCDGCDRVEPEDSEVLTDADGSSCWGNWCRRCGRVVGEWHKPDCRIPRVTRAERKLIAACGLSPDTNLAAFVNGMRSGAAADRGESC